MAGICHCEITCLNNGLIALEFDVVRLNLSTK